METSGRQEPGAVQVNWAHLPWPSTCMVHSCELYTFILWFPGLGRWSTSRLFPSRSSRLWERTTLLTRQAVRPPQSRVWEDFPYHESTLLFFFTCAGVSLCSFRMPSQQPLITQIWSRVMEALAFLCFMYMRFMHLSLPHPVHSWSRLCQTL